MEDQGSGAGWHNVSGGRIRSLPNAGQGDCLFRAISHQLDGDILAPALRERAVAYMLDNLQEFSAQLLGLGWDMQESGEIPPGDYDAEMLPIVVLNILRLEWTWGGAECIAALSRLLRRRIIVYQENAVSVHFNPIEEEQGDALRLLHRIGNDGRRTHYESVLRWLPERSVAVNIADQEVRPALPAPAANPVEDEPSPQPPCKMPRLQNSQESPPLDVPARMQLRPRATCFTEDSFRSDYFSDSEGCDSSGTGEDSDPIGFTCCLICRRRLGRYGLIPCGHFPACGTCIRVRFLLNDNRCTRCGSQVIGWTKVFNQN